nr:hypothetical protein CFP56_05427 [Quercus suber]
MKNTYRRRPWSIKGGHLVLKEWNPSLAWQEINFKSSVLWVQVHGLPELWGSTNNLRLLSEKARKVVELRAENTTTPAELFHKPDHRVQPAPTDGDDLNAIDDITALPAQQDMSSFQIAPQIPCQNSIPQGHCTSRKELYQATTQEVATPQPSSPSHLLENHVITPPSPVLMPPTLSENASNQTPTHKRKVSKTQLRKFAKRFKITIHAPEAAFSDSGTSEAISTSQCYLYTKVMVGFYGPSYPAKKQKAWENLMAFINSYLCPWVCIGNFNFTTNDKEILGGNRSGESSTINYLKEFIFEFGAIDLGFSGNSYTWARGRWGSSIIK